MESLETRFAHLLQPIRELMKNWDVDLATQLGEYLEELDHMTISFDGGKTTVNFAEAALLIQGSTCIYGRKVELLHSLVFQTLDCISNKNKRRDGKGSTSADGVADGDAADSEDCEFEELGIEPNSHCIVMKDDPEPVNIVRLPPESLISAEAQVKQQYPLLSLKGEVLGSYKDFRISNFHPNESGILSLAPRSASAFYLNRESAEVHAEGKGEGQGVSGCAAEGEGGEVCGRAADQSDLENGANVDELPPLMDNDMEVDPEPEEHVERHQALSERRMLRERPTVQPVAEEPKQLQEAEDPWAWLDPYENVGEDKPLKTAKCYNVPAGLEESGKRKRKGPSKLQDFLDWCTSAYEDKDRKLKNGPLYPEFNYIYLSKMDQRLKLRKKVLHKKGVYVSDEALKRTYLEPENQDEVLRHADVDGEHHSDPDLEQLVVDPEAGDYDDDAEANPVFSDSQMGRISYEDLVKKSVELFLANSQKYAQETALSRRVKEWEDEINPLLLAQEDRLVFDIHEYGDRIVHAIGTVGHKRSFASLVSGMENTEACRYMLASLQLANDYTVEIDKSAGLEESIDTMELTLKSKQRAHERLRMYAAEVEHQHS